MSGCELCDSAGGRVLWQGPTCRVVLPDAEPRGTCRVVLARHVPEMTDLDPNGRGELMRAVFATEAALRAVMVPDKVNLASLGNLVPHLHLARHPALAGRPVVAGLGVDRARARGRAAGAAGRVRRADGGRAAGSIGVKPRGPARGDRR